MVPRMVVPASSWCVLRPGVAHDLELHLACLALDRAEDLMRGLREFAERQTEAVRAKAETLESKISDGELVVRDEGLHAVVRDGPVRGADHGLGLVDGVGP